MPLLLGGLLTACATTKTDDPGFDEPDLRLPDETADFSVSPPDLTGNPQDLSSSSPDLSGSTDLRQTPDLSQPPADLAPITGCQLVPTMGCPAGQKCTTHDGAGTICDPNGSAARGAACTVTSGIDNCISGNVCIDEGGGLSQCRLYCTNDTQCGTRSYCELTLGGTGMFKICTQACNAIYPATGAGSGCSNGLTCRPYGKEHTDCVVPGTVNENSPCAAPGDCKAGLVCIGPAGAGTCRRVCKYRTDSNCSATQFCFDITSGGTPWVLYGLCCPAAGC